MEKNQSFGAALEAVKKGKLISREGWNGKGMFVFQRPSQELSLGEIGVYSSLPMSFKIWANNLPSPLTAKIPFTAYLCMKAADNSIVNGWLASQTDMLANDWCIHED